MKKKKSKGTLGEPRLSLSRKYIVPPSRHKLMLWGAFGMLILLAFVSVNFSFFRGSFLSNGPLSSNHAGMEGDCSACHTQFASVTSEKCSDCHETGATAVGAYSFTAHYLYHTDDFQRDIPSTQEMTCANCHQEHLGRTSRLTQVSDNRCLTCHEGHSFDTDHPIFARVSEEEEAPIKFPHVAHVREIMQEMTLANVEDACVHCHQMAENGKHFLPIDFDRDCDDCHLNSAESTPRLPIGNGSEPGVLTLQAIQARQSAGSRWSLFSNPNEFRILGGRLISKSPLHHRDPWILENLRDFRKQVYPDAGLADLIQSSVQVPPNELKSLYAEAIATLEGYAVELRARPEAEVQEELARINQILARAKQQLDDPYVLLDETEFLLALQKPRADIAPETLEEIHTLANDLTEPCQTCHLLDELTIVRVEKNQRLLDRAKFNHRAHLLQRGCLDCHNKFPEGAFALEDPPDVEMFAEVQNLPDIDTCRECHSQDSASNSCITCHQFHPDQKQFSPNPGKDL